MLSFPLSHFRVSNFLGQLQFAIDALVRESDCPHESPHLLYPQVFEGLGHFVSFCVSFRFEIWLNFNLGLFWVTVDHFLTHLPYRFNFDR